VNRLDGITVARARATRQTCSRVKAGLAGSDALGGTRRPGAARVPAINRARGPVPQLVVASRPRVGVGPMRHIGRARSSVTVGARPLLQTSDELASRAKVLGRRSTRARVDGSCNAVTWTSRGRTTARTRVRLRRVRVDRLGPGAGYAPRGGHGLGQGHFPRVLISDDWRHWIKTRNFRECTLSSRT